MEPTPQQTDDLCYATYRLLKIMGNVYGADKSWEMFEAFWKVLGDGVKNSLFLKMLDSNFTSSHQFTFTALGGNKISVIKALRSYCCKSIEEPHVGLSLKEAKDIADSAEHGGRATVYCMNDAHRHALINELTQHGCRVY